MDADSTNDNLTRVKRRRTLVALITAHVLVSLATFAIGRTYRLQLILLVITGLSLCTSQAALLGLWFGFGRKRSPKRLLLCALTLLAILFILVFGVYSQESFDESVLITLGGLLAATFTASVLAAIALRRTGAMIGLESDLPNNTAPARLQFTMFDLFGFTTAVALLTTGASALRGFLDGEYEFDTVGLLVVAVTAAIPPLMVAALSRLRLGWRLLAAASIALIALPLRLPFDDWFGPIILAAVAGIALASLLVVRHAGYRVYVRERCN
jgi:hypothetical protein